jgi:3-hydroxyisobutyrate dehydrogenase-like beta-hydroxyacid dehydrogenase
VQTIGIVSPGAMGSGVASALTRGGARVVATLAGRSARTETLAGRAEVEVLPNLAAVVREADVILSIVPPGAAESVAGDVYRVARDLPRPPLLVELNAIAPATARAVEDEAPPGLDVVDGSISGPPPWRAGTTRMYLSGRRAEKVAGLPFDGVDRIVVGGTVGAASAVKMSTASVYKGSTALLAQALLAANAHCILEHVVADLHLGAPELVGSVERRLAMAASKSSRYVDEMHEIAATQASVGLLPELFEAVADVYAALAGTQLAEASPEDVPADLALEQVLDQLDPRRTNVGR